MNKIARTCLVGIAVSLLLTTAGPLQQVAAANDNDRGPGPIRRVLLISIDGMHALDYANCVNGGYCPHLTALGQNGVSYTRTSASKPSDSFPGLMALVAGGTPRTVGAFYDVAYDRVLAPAQKTTVNGHRRRHLYPRSRERDNHRI